MNKHKKILIAFFLPLFAHAEFLNLDMKQGIAKAAAAQYHLANSAAVMEGPFYKADGFYFFNSKEKVYGLSLANRKDLPIALTWIWNGSKHYRAFSIAGRLSQRWSLGVGIKNITDDKKFFVFNRKFSPHIGWLYKIHDDFFLGFTGERINKEFLYGFGWFYSFNSAFNLYGDVHFDHKQWQVWGGLEWKTEDYFAVKIESSWPDPFYRAGIRLLGKPITLDYTWLQNKGHLFAVRIDTQNIY